MKRFSWISGLIILLVVTFFALLTGMALAADDDIVFTCALEAPETWIEPEGQVDFLVELANSGQVDIERFEIITPDAMLAGEYGALDAGESVLVEVPIVFNKEGEYPVELYVVGYAGGESLTRHTNSVVITVSSEPKPTEEPEEEVIEEPAEQTEEAVHTEQPAEQTEQAAVQTEETEETSAQAETEEDQPEEHSDRTMLYVIIGALGVVLLALVIVIFGVLNKNRHKNEE